MHGGWAMPGARTQSPLKEEGLRPAGHRGPHPGPGGRGGVPGLPVAAGPGLQAEVWLRSFPSFVRSFLLAFLVCHHDERAFPSTALPALLEG